MFEIKIAYFIETFCNQHNSVVGKRVYPRFPDPYFLKIEYTFFSYTDWFFSNIKFFMQNYLDKIKVKWIIHKI